MNTYELVYIVDAHASQGTKDEIAKQVADAITKSEIKLVSSQMWLDRHKMSFPIKKLVEGTYYLLNLEAQSPAITKLQGLLRINEQILRFLTVKVYTKSA